jgi:arginase family enzyme
MPKFPTYVIDYPEAHTALAAISDAHDVKAAGVLPALGDRPVSIDGEPPDLPAEPFVVVNGSGNYHHETVPLVQGFLKKRPEQRFAYVQIDAHPDKDDRFRWKCDCASFVGRVMREPQIDSVWLVGINPGCLIDEDRPDRLVTRRVSYYGDRYFTKLREYVTSNEIVEQFYKFNEVHERTARENPSAASVEVKDDAPPVRNHLLDSGEPEPCIEVRWKTVDELDMARDLPDLPVYLTIDLDVSREKPVTDWKERDKSLPDNRWGVPDNQGVMAWEDVIGLVEQLGESRRVVAADFCGLTKRIDGLRDDARKMSLDAMVEIYAAVTQAMAHGG